MQIKEEAKAISKKYDDWREIVIAELNGEKEIKIKCFASDFRKEA